MKAFIVRIFQHGPGRAPTLHSVATLPATLGRAVDSHLPILHRSISLHHARFEEREDDLYLVDLSSTNGIAIRGKRYGEYKIERNTTLYLGAVRVQIFVKNPREKTIEIPLQTLQKMPSTKRDLAVVIASWLALTGVEFLRYLQEPGDTRGAEPFALSVLWLVGTGLLAGLLSLISRALRGRFVYAHFWSICLLSVLAVRFFFTFNEFISFNLFHASVAALFLHTYVFCCFYFLIVSLSKNLSSVIIQQRSRWFAAGISLAMIGLVHLGKYIADIDGAHFNYRGAVAYPIFAVTDSPPGDFTPLFGKMDKNAAHLEKMRFKENDDKFGDDSDDD